MKKKFLIFCIFSYSLIPFDSHYLYVDAEHGNIIQKKQILNKSDISESRDTLLKSVDGININHKDSIENKQLIINSCTQPCIQDNAWTIFYEYQTIYTREQPHNGSCRHILENTCHGTSLHVVHSSGNEYYQGADQGDWNQTGDKPGTTALWCLQWAFDYYWTLGQNSWNNNGGNVRLRTGNSNHNSGEPDDGDVSMLQITIMKDDPDGPYINNATSLDCIGHEFSHGVIYNSSMIYNDSLYDGEAYALTDAFCDIMGTTIEYYALTHSYGTGRSPDYIIGAECHIDGCLRNMAYPKLSPNPHCPNTKGGQYWINVTNSGTLQDKLEAGHINCGVMDYWFYLLCEGDQGTNDPPFQNDYCVKAIGRDKAAWITYRAFHSHLANMTSFDNARDFTILEAAGEYGANSNEVAQVTNAWYAVGVGNKYAGKIEYNNPLISGSETLNYNNEVLFYNLQVPSNTSLTITSDTKITVKSNSRAHSNSNFLAYIYPACNGGAKSMEIPSNYSPSSDTVSFEPIKEETKKESELLVIPNPSNGLFTIQYINSILENASLQVINMLSNIVYESTLRNQQSQQIDLSGLAVGMYYVRVQNAERSFTEKVVIQR